MVRIRSTSGILNITCYLLLRHLNIYFHAMSKKTLYLSFLAYDDGEGDEFKGTRATGKVKQRVWSGVGRRVKRGCMKRSCPFGAFLRRTLKENSPETVLKRNNQTE
ncbi:hypothetical protein F2Q70_00017180 [Brassica cretica]|uniref:Uncharacterized protein n=1 Tax=Brassica cretica TaxID=69181 RepID=A0A8S9I074_BRACR|nr:hypothetical protein F2Q70_00017180 [Brassica cretica]